jgi:hypothetical protein
MESIPHINENFEGRLEIDGRKITLDGEEIGVVALGDHGEYVSVSFITINEDLRGKGIGEIVYNKIASQTDKPLRSDIHISDLAEHMWEKFVKKGLAKKIGNIPSGKSQYEWIK